MKTLTQPLYTLTSLREPTLTKIVFAPARRKYSDSRRSYSDYTPIAQDIKTNYHGFLPSEPAQTQAQIVKQSGLERLPTSSLLRNILLGTLFTSPLLFKAGFSVLNHIANSRSSILNPDVNPVLRALVKPIVYDQFCAGTNQKEIFKTRDEIRQMGYSGVILCYGREIQVTGSEMRSTGKGDGNQAIEVKLWRDGNLETLDMIGKGDWVGMKITGAGSAVTQALMDNKDPPPEFVAAMDAILEKARDQGARVWMDAEQQVVQTAIDRWTIDLMRKYNRNGQVVVYNTIQSYLKASRQKLKHQLALAEKEGWTLAVKLVRGAYIANDQRELIHDTKEDTDNSYNGIVHDLLSGTNLGFEQSKFPKMELFLAGHNPESVAKAWDLIQKRSAEKSLKVLPEFGQLQGMADHLGCKILQRCDDVQAEKGGKLDAVVPKVYKCLTWGSIQECMQYLLRRLVENRGGADRMRDGLTVYWAELKRRVFRRA